MTNPDGQEREALEGAVIGDGTCLETTPRDNFRNGFGAGYRAALADLKPKIDAFGEGFFDGLAQKAGSYDE